MSNIDIIFDEIVNVHFQIQSDPQIRQLNHKIEVCESWLKQSALPTDSLPRLQLEVDILDEILYSIEQNEEQFRTEEIHRINGEAGRYNDVSGSILELCTRWVGMGVMKDFPVFSTEQITDSSFTIGNHIKVIDDGGINIDIVTYLVEETPTPQRTDNRSFQYSNSIYAIASLKLNDEATIRQRLTQAQLEITTLQNTPEYMLQESIIVQKGKFEDVRKELIEQIKKEISAN